MEGLLSVAKRLRIELSHGQARAFEDYYELLTTERERAGLTSLTERGEVERRHFGEALAVLKALEDCGDLASPAIDIGSGAGFPGVPIKIVRPELELTLLEATGKKARFLEQLVARLALSGVTVINARAETAAHDARYRGAYALAFARAVAPLRTLVELAVPFLRIGGLLAAPKGSGAQREVAEAAAALQSLGATVERVQRLPALGPGPAPQLVTVRKIRETPDRFPRRPGIPSKRPL